MRTVLGFVLGVLAILAVVFVTGLIFPRDHPAVRRITVRKPPEDAWPVVRDLGSLVGVWSDLKSAHRLPDNPLFRTMMKVMGVHQTADGYLWALGKKLGETVTPEHVE